MQRCDQIVMLTQASGAGFILCICPANERQRYNVTLSLIGWTHAHLVLSVPLLCLCTGCHWSEPVCWATYVSDLHHPYGTNAVLIGKHCKCLWHDNEIIWELSPYYCTGMHPILLTYFHLNGPIGRPSDGCLALGALSLNYIHMIKP